MLKGLTLQGIGVGHRGAPSIISIAAHSARSSWK
jgi:hypothetical protein